MSRVVDRCKARGTRRDDNFCAVRTPLTHTIYIYKISTNSTPLKPYTKTKSFTSETPLQDFQVSLILLLFLRRDSRSRRIKLYMSETESCTRATARSSDPLARCVAPPEEHCHVYRLAFPKKGAKRDRSLVRCLGIAWQRKSDARVRKPSQCCTALSQA